MGIGRGSYNQAHTGAYQPKPAETFMGTNKAGHRHLFIASALWVAAASALGSSPAAAGGPRWSVVPSPNVEFPNGTYSAVSCPSPRVCVAGGSYVDASGFTRPLAGTWKQNHWDVAAPPGPVRAPESELNGISCPSIRHCVAVGYYLTHKGRRYLAFSDAWNGGRWRRLEMPNPAGPTSYLLRSVSCASADLCIAVGYSSLQFPSFPDETYPQGGYVPLAERWNGHAWSVEPPADLGNSAAGDFTTISCPSVTSCEAVGSYSLAFGSAYTLAEGWNGQKWTVQYAPYGSYGNVLVSVSCSAAVSCVAIGSDSDGALADRWDGGRWAPLGISLPLDGSLDAISCPSVSHCTAAGSYFASGGGFLPLIEAWNGNGWAVQPAPSPTGGFDLAAVSCAADADCIAVGAYETTGTLPNLILALRWGGKTWAQLPVAGLLGGTWNELSSVACPGQASCIAVGHSTGAGVELPLLERWNGRVWSIQRDPNLGPGVSAVLSAVSCASATECTAVGSYRQNLSQNFGDEPIAPLIEHWNGRQWSIQHVPRPAHASSIELDGVSCGSSVGCTAVGFYWYRDAFELPLVERWDGSRWKIQVVANPRTVNAFAEVSCPAANSCTAVGTPFDGGIDLTSAASWDGAQWRHEPTPNPSNAYSADLRGVFCPTASTCLATGDYSVALCCHDAESYPGPLLPLLERWDGTKWTIQRGASGISGGELTAVSCVSAESCASVGYCTNGKRCSATLVERWNGRRWAVETTSELPKGQSVGLNGVACQSMTTCVAVGTRFIPVGPRWPTETGKTETFVEGYFG